jgi:glycosyltransferase involved in cell wall biosynthesis
MISIGDNILIDSPGASLERQLEYAGHFNSLDMIVYSLKSKGLEQKTYGNLTIHPTKSLSMLTFVNDVLRISKKIILRKKVSVVTTQDPFGTALAGYMLKKKYNIPLHIQNHSSFINNNLWISERPLLFRFFNRLAYFTINKADRLRVVNFLEREIYINDLKIDKDIVDICPVPIDVNYWQIKPSEKDIQSFIEDNNININKKILSWAGRVSKVKNLPFLFDSVSKVNHLIDIELLIAGDMSNYSNELVELKNIYGVEPIFLDKLTHDQLKIMYYISDAYIHTSNYEGFGLVLCEAQACGTPVVTRNTAASRFIIDNGLSGYIVNGNEQEFCNKVLITIHENKKNKMGIYAKKMIGEKFNRANMTNAVIKSIRKTVPNTK